MAALLYSALPAHRHEGPAFAHALRPPDGAETGRSDRCRVGQDVTDGLDDAAGATGRLRIPRVPTHDMSARRRRQNMNFVRKNARFAP
jgi:hypothetical protein